MVLIAGGIQISSPIFMEDSMIEGLASCLDSILKVSFTPGTTLVVITLELQNETMDSISTNISDLNGNSFEDCVLKTLHDNSNWPMLILDNTLTETEIEEYAGNFEACIFFLNYQNLTIMEQGLKNLMYEYYEFVTNIKNFIVLSSYLPDDYAMKIAEGLFDAILYQIINANTIILVPMVDEYENNIEIYTWYPFEGENCGNISEGIQLIYKSGLAQDGKLVPDVDFFPEKLPSNANGCPLYIYSMGIAPYVILKDNKTLDNGDSTYKVEGLSVECVSSFAEKFNFTPIYSEPINSLEFETLNQSEYYNFTNYRITNIYVEVVPNDFRRETRIKPHLYETVRYLVPCPKSLRRNDSILSVFQLSLWLAVLFTLFLASVALWILGVRNVDSTNFKQISLCFYNAWAVLLGVSATAIPVTPRLRIVFLLYVCYSLCINTVFQAYFVTYLVEPGYSKTLKTMEDVYSSRIPLIVYYPLQMYELFTDTDLDSYREAIGLPCETDIYECVMSLINEGKSCAIIGEKFAQYLASKMGYGKYNEALCYVDDLDVTRGISVLFDEGAPMLRSFNKFVSKYTEAGLLERYWSLLRFRQLLKSNRKMNDKYFVYEMNHVLPIFIFQLISWFLCTLIFLIELCFKFIVNIINFF